MRFRLRRAAGQSVKDAQVHLRLGQPDLPRPLVRELPVELFVDGHRDAEVLLCLVPLPGLLGLVAEVAVADRPIILAGGTVAVLGGQLLQQREGLLKVLAGRPGLAQIEPAPPRSPRTPAPRVVPDGRVGVVCLFEDRLVKDQAVFEQFAVQLLELGHRRQTLVRKPAQHLPQAGLGGLVAGVGQDALLVRLVRGLLQARVVNQHAHHQGHDRRQADRPAGRGGRLARVHFHSRSPSRTGRATIGWPCRNRSRSSASAPAVT